MRTLVAPLSLVAARARRRPGRWLLPALGLALAAALLGGIAAAATVSGDKAARSKLADLPPLARTVRLTWQGPSPPSVDRHAPAVLRGLGLRRRTEVVLLRPARLRPGIIVRAAAISPLGRWLPGGVARGLSRCRPRDCSMLEVGGRSAPRRLSAAGVRIRVVGRSTLRSPVPLGYVPDESRGSPLLVSSDAQGLSGLGGLGGIYRTETWFAPLSTASLHSWQLPAVQSQLRGAEARIVAREGQLSFSGPFAGLARARAQASAAPRRLLLAGGGAAAALVLFIVLAAGGLRRDQLAEIRRLEAGGARRVQTLAFIGAESALISGAALMVGAALALAAAVVLAAASGEPIGGVLMHSLITPGALAALGGAWLVATVVLALPVIAPGARVADVLAIAAAAALAFALARGGTGGSLALLVAPLCCLAAGVLVYRLARVLAQAAERAARRGPIVVRLALVGLARAPAAPALAVAFLAVCVGLGGFALAYRATLLRSASDQAADRVPLDATIAPGRDFQTPLERAPLTRWREFAHGKVFPVRRTDANYPAEGRTVTVPAIGVPAGALTLLHGWRAGDGSAPLTDLAHRIQPVGPVRRPGPMLPRDARALTVRAASPGVDMHVIAELRRPSGAIRRLPLGTTGRRPEPLRARIPPGRWEVEALELDEPAGLAITNGHQNGENAAAATQFVARVAIGPLRVLGRGGRAAGVTPLGSWRAVGAASPAPTPGRLEAHLRFSTSGEPGVLRPVQPSDRTPIPVLVDPATAAVAGPGGRLTLTVDGLPVTGRVVGVLHRFPTLPANAAGFVVADESALAAALDAQLPGQGRPDDLWVASTDTSPLRRALAHARLAQLSASFRGDVERRLRDAPIARAILGTLVAASAICAVLALVGQLLAFLGPGRDDRVERDLAEQGIGPRGLRAELRTRFVLAAASGIIIGVGIAAVLTRLAVASVRAAGSVAVPRPPLVTVVPWGALAAWALAVFALLLLAGLLASRRQAPTGRARRGAASEAAEVTAS